MQTFLPLPDFKKTVEVLDYRRLGKQRVEAHQILNTLQGRSRGWANHPATRMWRGFEDALGLYLNTCILEWTHRGYKNTMSMYSHVDASKIVMPPWFGDDAFHASHRSNLLRKNFEYYSRFGWTEKPDMEYVWPI